MFGTLYIVGTPIGNLSDITLRAVDTLKSVDLILAEDTRVTRKLLGHLGIEKELKTYNQHTFKSRDKLNEILLVLLSGKSIALVTDAGIPGISDPGNELVSFLCSVEPNLKIVPIGGVSSLTSLLSVSGLNVSNFVFLGFLPKKKRSGLWTSLKEFGRPFFFYESPHRLVTTLGEISSVFGPETRVVVGREITKVFETIYRGSVVEVLALFSSGKVLGEVSVIVEF